MTESIARLPGEVVIHRVSGDGPKSLLLEPAWSGSKRLVLNTIAKKFRENGLYQGIFWGKNVQKSVF